MVFKPSSCLSFTNAQLISIISKSCLEKEVDAPIFIYYFFSFKVYIYFYLNLTDKLNPIHFLFDLMDLINMIFLIILNKKKY